MRSTPFSSAKKILRKYRRLHERDGAISFLLSAAIVVTFVCLTAFLYQQYFLQQLHFSDVTYDLNGGEHIDGNMPLYVLTEGETILTVRLLLDIPKGYPKSMRIIPDDCLESIAINGENVASDSLPICPPAAEGHVYDLTQYISTGKNVVQISVKDFGGLAALKIVPEYHVPSRIATASLYLFALLLAIFIPYKKAHA